MKLKENCIFVSVASYRDKACNDTVKSLFENADNPENVFVGICQQNNEEEDDDCKTGYENNPNVKIIRIPHYEAKGPTYARWLCATLVDGEEYFLQVDSHTKFVKGWDTKCINMIKDLKAMGVEKPVISHYPREYKDYEKMKDKDKTVVPRICRSFFNNRDMISYFGPEIMDSNDEYYKVPFITGGMFFADSKFLRDVPYDPNLPYLFVGEEILHSARFFTCGWDVYNPKENVIFHKYTRKGEIKVWDDNKNFKDNEALDKVKYLIKIVDDDSKVTPAMKINIEKYGLGTERTLKEFYDFAGIDVAEKKVTKNFCRKDNVATAEDIEKSYEKRKPLIVEKFTFPGNNDSVSSNIIFYGIGAILLISIICIFIFLKDRK